MNDTLRYRTGENIQAGDHILYHGEEGRVQFVASPDDPETAWYIQEFGRGCMLTPTFGFVFVSDTENDEDLDFVSR